MIRLWQLHWLMLTALKVILYGDSVEPELSGLGLGVCLVYLVVVQLLEHEFTLQLSSILLVNVSN